MSGIPTEKPELSYQMIHMKKFRQLIQRKKFRQLIMQTEVIHFAKSRLQGTSLSGALHHIDGKKFVTFVRG